jgi:PA14 domain-containing protein
MMCQAIRLLLMPVLVIGVAAQDDPEQMPHYTFGTTVVRTSGLEGRIYHLKEGTERLPRFSPKKAVGTVYSNRLNIPPQRFEAGFPGITDRFEWFAVDYNGEFWIENPGVYQFSLLSDDGALLRIDGKVVIDMDGLHTAVKLTAKAELTRGVHRIRLSYFQGPRYMVALVFSMGGPGETLRIFDTDDYMVPERQSGSVEGKISNISH